MQACSRSLSRLSRLYKNGNVMFRCSRTPVQASYCTVAEAIPPPQAEGQPKEYSQKIKKLVDDIAALTLLEVADLNQHLKDTLKISDAPMMAAMPVGAQDKKEEESSDEPAAVKTTFNVKITKYDESKKVALIKEIKSAVSGLNLVQAKKLVESLPQIVKTDLPKEEADKVKAALEGAGGVVEIE